MTDSATTLLNSATSSTAATSVSEFASSIASKFKKVGPLKLPLPNILNSYASYTYILSICVLTDDDIVDPDNTYMANKSTLKGKESALRIICKSANADPFNRIKTDYGTFDFFIDNLTIDSVIGLEQSNNTNATTMTFTITEPYSMGLFSIACQQAAWEAGHNNWREAPFLLTIEFRGNNETGQMELVPTASRYIPFRWQEMNMVVNQNGAVYQCSIFAWSTIGLTDRNAKLKSDMSVKGSTVQEVLQTGPESLQAVWNRRLQQLKEDKLVEVPDEIIILFPEDVSSSGDSSNSGSTEDNSSATIGSASNSTQNPVYTKLGVSTGKNNTQVQDPKKCNIIGKSVIGAGAERTADAPFGNDSAVYDEKAKVFIRTNNTPTSTSNDFRFSQDTSIPNAINQVILKSNFFQGAMDPKALSEEGYLKFWRIDIQVYNISTDANMATTGTKPKVIVYRVIPYNVHGSSAPKGSNAKAKGLGNLYAKVVKEFQYLYTGKNTEVIQFEIKIENSFAVAMAADAGKRSQDVLQGAEEGQEGSTNNKDPNTIVLNGNAPNKAAMPGSASYTRTITNTAKKGGSGTDSAATLAARIFYDSVTRGTDMIMLDMHIVGDPFFIAQSGQGNYTAKPTEYPNLNSDGSVNWQNGEVHISVIFRTPIDIMDTTGMYQFRANVPSTPVMQYSGLFRINQATSTFKDGKFEQHLIGQRLDQQENPTEATSSFSLDNLLKDGIAAIGKALD
jgi:hypothetical protein